MAISFEKHRNDIIAAWKDVLDDKSSTNWALFDYEGQTNELKVHDSGNGGLEELVEDLNSGKIMYAFVRIEDPKTGLKKYLLINWQGEGAPVLRKGTCANHIHDVSKILSGAHLTISARNEDDVDLDRLLKKLSNVSTAYSFKEPRSNIDEQKTAVGTNYNRVIPTKELNTSVMQDFWKKEEEEEKRRIEAEKELKRQEQLKLEAEQRAREEKEHLEREKKVLSNAKLHSAHVPIKTSPQPLSPEKTIRSFNTGKTEAERMRQMRNQEARELIGSRVGAAKAIFTQNTSEGQLQNKLNSAPPTKPARTSIAQRINAFNQQTISSNENLPKPSTVPSKIVIPKAIQNDENNTDKINHDKSTPVENKTSKSSFVEATIAAASTAAPTETELLSELKTKPVTETKFLEAVTANNNSVTTTEPLQEPVKPEVKDIANNDDVVPTNDDYITEPEAEHFSTIKRSPHSKSNSLQSPDETSSSNATDTAVYQDQDDDEEEVVRTKVSVTVQQPQSTKNGLVNSVEPHEICDLVNEDDFICQEPLSNIGLKARALYDYQAADESEITFDPGDIITHIDPIDEGWWQGLGPDGTYGLFPANYVEIIDEITN